MAKNDKPNAASEPTIAAPPVAPPPEEVVTEPEIEAPVSTLPAGVQMHDAGPLPYTADRAQRLAHDPSQAPPGHKGSFGRCGGCGDFLGMADRCPKCAPARLPPNVVNGGP